MDVTCLLHWNIQRVVSDHNQKHHTIAQWKKKCFDFWVDIYAETHVTLNGKKKIRNLFSLFSVRWEFQGNSNALTDNKGLHALKRKKRQISLNHKPIDLNPSFQRKCESLPHDQRSQFCWKIKKTGLSQFSGLNLKSL